MDDIGDDVSRSAKTIRRDEILPATELHVCAHVPNTKRDVDAAIGLAGDAPGDKRVGMDSTPIGLGGYSVFADRFYSVGDEMASAGPDR
jgi:hypothetical protein